MRDSAAQKDSHDVSDLFTSKAPGTESDVTCPLQEWLTCVPFMVFLPRNKDLTVCTLGRGSPSPPCLG